MRYIKFLLASVALVVAAACVNTEVDDKPIISAGSKGELQIVGRVTQYSDCDVATRSKKEGDEPKVTSMGLALFPIENGVVGNCLYYDYQVGGSIVFIVDRHNDVFKNYDDKQFAMYIFANMQGADGFPTTAEAGVGMSLEDFKKCAVATSTDVENVPENGFPMMGSLGHTDGKELILKPSQTDTNVDGLPLVDNNPTDNLEIPLRSMYAKFTFTIAVKPDQEIVGNKAPRFDLLGYTVSNLPSTVDSDETTNEDNAVIASSDEYSFTGKYAQGATTATFDFYLPERYLTPTKSLDEVLPPELKKGTYDKSVDADQNGYRDEDEKYHQRYKNNMVDGKAATYITFNGKYTDHQEDVYEVNYNIYLGGNNCDNFDVIRNTHYNNSITIRGISTSNDQATNTDGIAIDWRVNVERSTPLVINLRRESLLDAHFEVRPLRLRLVGENIPNGTSATVSILNEDGKTTSAIPDWIRLEASGSSANHITSGVSAGKRKYFTTDLVTTTLAETGKSITVNNLTGSNQTLWIYVDENTTTTSRAAIVRVSYNGVNKDYKVVQSGLYAVETTRDATEDGVGGSYTYYIEQYEEYLYNYDAEDSYGQTEWNGMEWGLNGIQLSNIEDAFVISHITGEGNNFWDNIGDFTARQNQAFETLSPKPKYDFYLYRDIISIMGEYYMPDLLKDNYYADKLKINNYDGFTLNDKIAKHIKSNYSSHQNVNDDKTYIAKIDKITLDQTPKSAFAYCYNRNKRNANGEVEEIVWYLPAIDEIEDIVEYAHGSFEDFQNNMYWSCQPAYIRTSVELQRYRYFILWWEAVSGNVYYGSYFTDDTDRARATKAERENGVFKEAPSSGADESMNRTGIIYISATNSKNTTWDNPTTTNTNPYHEGNLSRTGTKARVRCVRKM